MLSCSPELRLVSVLLVSVASGAFLCELGGLYSPSYRLRKQPLGFILKPEKLSGFGGISSDSEAS